MTRHQSLLADSEYMFRAVGQVMHLLEDTTQPQHVRNEQHLEGTIWQSTIEIYGNDHVRQLNYGDGSMLDWRGAGFIKLEDFWDRHLYNGTSSQPLIDNEDPTKPTSTLGLAEWCNGNFLGERHTYAEFFDKTSIKYYPFPSLTNTTQPQLKPGNLAGTVIDSITLRNHMTGDRVYISKTGAGVPVTHHSALNYLAVQNTPRLGGLQMQVGLTIHDDNVLSNYHDIFIPKAVKYSAGLLDYFFRGTIDVGLIGYDTNTMQYTNLIVNTSGQDFYGGAFYLLLETNGVRILIQSNSLSGTIASGASTNMIFPGPLPTNQSKLFLVYQGTIGVTNGNQALDPADANICIAANRVWIEQTKTYIYHPWLYEI